MKRTVAALLCLALLGSLNAYEAIDSESPLFTEIEKSKMLILESEIDALLEEENPLNGQSQDQDTFFAPSTPLLSPSAKPEEATLPIRNLIDKVNEQKREIPSFPVEMDEMMVDKGEIAASPKQAMESIRKETTKSIQTIEVNLKQVFEGSPIIYTLLFFLSTISICVWLYSMLTIRAADLLPPKLIKELREKLVSDQFDEALDLCIKRKHFFCKMLASGILARRHGLNAMIDTMKSEGKRSTVGFWQRISILNEIAIIAPMLGLLGTVLGMFYAFYDLNRSMESVSLLFDGLGISVGTTVAGLIVAILAMILYSVAKYRLVRILTTIENEAQSFAALIDNRMTSSG